MAYIIEAFIGHNSFHPEQAHNFKGSIRTTIIRNSEKVEKSTKVSLFSFLRIMFDLFQMRFISMNSF